MRKIINKNAAIRAIVLLIALIAVLTIYPFRLWTGIYDFSAGGELVETSEYVNFESSLEQKFITQYDRLSSVDVYINDMDKGRYISVSILDENAGELFRVYVDTNEYQLPGYVNVPIELNVEVGKEYYLLLQSCRSKYSVGLEDVTADSAYVGSLFYTWQEIPARHLAAVYNYRLPLSRSKSLLGILIIALLSAIILTATDLYYRKKPEKNEIYTVERTVRMAANPIAAIVFASLMLMVFPLRIFDLRVVDIVFYEVGLVIAAGIVLYAINHRSVKHSIGISFWQRIEAKDRVRYVLMMFSIAMSIWYACEYMNDLYEIYHTLSVRKIIIWLLVLIILTFSARQFLNIYNIVWVVVSAIFGTVYYNSNALADTEKEYDLHNLALKYLMIIIVLAGLVIINMSHNITTAILKKEHAESGSKVTLSVFGILLLLLFSFLIIFRNTRVWGIYLVAIFAALYVRMYFWEGRKDWYKILSGGLMLNFALSLGFSLLHRYFPAYVSGRFAFIFHTVTVTAEYLTFMAATATVMLCLKVVSFPRKMPFGELFKSAWKELVLFGFIMAYTIFTVSRTAYVATIASMLAVMLVVTAKKKKEFFRIIGVMIAAVILCFPAAFTMQRIIPCIVADPVFYDIDDADVLVRGGANPGSTNFMCVERFVNLFASKIFGVEMGDYSYPDDRYNYDENGVPLYDIYGYSMDNPVENFTEPSSDDGESGSESGKNTIIEPLEGELVSGKMTYMELSMLMTVLNDYVDETNTLDVISNGRITIYKSYLKELNLTGHDEMGAELPGGEIALHAHNVYIQVAYDNGIITGILFIIVIIASFVASICLYNRSQKDEPLTLLAFAIATGFAVAGITEWVFHFGNPLTLALMFSFVGLIFKEKKHE